MEKELAAKKGVQIITQTAGRTVVCLCFSSFLNFFRVELRSMRTTVSAQSGVLRNLEGN